MGAYTIGFLGHFAYTERICDYMDTLILRTLQQHGEVRVMVTLRREADRLMAGRVLEIGNLLPGLRLVPVITEQEERIYKKNSPSQSARERKRRLDAAGSYEVVPDILSSNKLPGYHQRFIERCDQIVYSTFRVPQYIRDDFARKVRMKKGRQPLVRYIMEGFSVSAPVSMEPMLDLHQSIEYIRRSGFRVMTDKLPQELLDKWLANADLPGNFMEFGVQEELADLFGRRDTDKAHYLLYKVFTAAYIVYHRLLTEPGSAACEEINSRFRQFRRLLKLLAVCRRKGIDTGRFDLLDFDNYDKIFKQFGWMDRLEKPETRLCDSEPGNTPSADGKEE